MIAAGIEYLEAGQGPPVICLHGIGGGAESFAPQMPVSPPDGGDPPGVGAGAPSVRAPMTTPPDPRNISGQMKEPVGLCGFRVMAWNMTGYGASAANDWPPTFESLSVA